MAMSTNLGTAVITGASRNIGAAIAIRLASDGFPVAINYYSDNERSDAQQVKDFIIKAGGRAEIYQCDVSKSDQIESMFAKLAVDLGAPSVLVNNAATSVASAITFREIDEQAWDEVSDTNLKGVFLCCKAFDKYSVVGTYRSIINISSIRVAIGMEGNSHYTAAKAALIGFGRVLARELGPSEIRVNSILPGAITTPDQAAYGDVAALHKMILESQSLKRLGMPVDIANLVSFLVGPDASFITGQSILCDGGWAFQ
ncbi:MAG: SDR family oxidoreductase [Actinobacteria bacterium]|nr:SDR family oxidoreductase [Actinomycetota bacterium]